LGSTKRKEKYGIIAKRNIVAVKKKNIERTGQFLYKPFLASDWSFIFVQFLPELNTGRHQQ
jgi:hypothetical protein